jgi:hypothetical protein
MKCTTKIQIERIAAAGAKKMLGEGYTFERCANPNVFKVVRPAAKGGGYYFVQFEGEGIKVHCFCAFFTENAAHGTCKHIVFVREELEAEAATVAQAEAYEDYRDFLADREDQEVARRMVGTAWPSCPLHGPHYAADNGQPMSTCDRCEECRFP